MRILVPLSMALLLIASGLAQSGGGGAHAGARVPDAETAVKIAEAALIPVYGKKQIASERPFIATLKDNVWTVAGTLHCPDGKGGVTDCVGGVAIVKLSRKSGRVLYMMHGK